MSDVSKNIRQIRESLGLSQSKIALRMHKTQQAYSRIELENKTVSIEDVENFAKAVDMNMIDVITWPKKYVDKDSIPVEPDISILNERVQMLTSQLEAKDKLIKLYETIHVNR